MSSRRLTRLSATALLVGLAVATGAAANGPPPQRMVFVSSAEGSGNLASWSVVPAGTTGLDAADFVCQYLASQAGLPDPGGFVAWLSDSSDDAYCRVHGFNGTKAGMCGGLSSLPTFAGPWVRTDGFPFASNVVEMLGFNGQVVTPALLDENGATLPIHYTYFTATDLDGVWASTNGSCTDWTSGAVVGVTVGDSRDTTKNWTDDGTGGCSGDHHLLCIEVGQGAPLPPCASSGALAFVTSATGTGDLSTWLEAGGLTGVTAADNVCRLRAGAAGLPEPDSFVAFLSDADPVDGFDARDRLTLDGPWIRVDGVQLAASKVDLLDGALATSLNVDEFGVFRPNEGAWTGTSPDGTASASDCDGWSTAGGTGTAGQVNTSSADWLGTFGTSCAAGFHLYCFSNIAAVIFTDDLESAGTTAWSWWVPASP